MPDQQQSRLRGGLTIALACVIAMAPCAPLRAEPATAATEPEAENYMQMSLEALLHLDVTSVTGAALPWFQNPAAVYTLSAEDIRRSGLTTIAEVLRLVPGMQVARVDSRQWAITARGFNSLFANKLLMLVDGRLVYDPSFSGVYWDTQDLLLEDIERIEVIRGPGATLWGSNAVNGVINITTKNAKDTHGLYLMGGGGTEERGFGGIRYGGSLGKGVSYRLWAKYVNRDSSREVGTGKDQNDAWDLPQGGFRMDVERERTRLSLNGEGYWSTKMGESSAIPLPQYSLDPQHPFAVVRDDRDGIAKSASLNARLERDTARGDRWTAQATYERWHRVLFAGIEATRDIVDADLRYRRKEGRHELMAGAGWYYVNDRSTNGLNLGTDPTDRLTQTVSGFVQDTVTLKAERWSLMVGSKFEHNDFTGFEYQPSGRLAFTPDAHHTLWAAVSRPVRVPAQGDRSVRLTLGYLDPSLAAGGPPSGFFIPLQIQGSEALTSERLTAWEAGYRIQLGDAFAVDVASFLNEYRDLVDYATNAAPVPTATGLGFVAKNDPAGGRGYGTEVALNWRASARFRATGSYSYMVATAVTSQPPSFARHIANLRSTWTATRRVELNTALYFTDRTQSGDAIFDRHLRGDLGLTVRPSDHVELALWGQDLFSPAHAEFDSPNVAFSQSEIQRGAYLQLTVRK
jgi:iron complex outermembrane recepter protein